MSNENKPIDKQTKVPAPETLQEHGVINELANHVAEGIGIGVGEAWALNKLRKPQPPQPPQSSEQPPSSDPPPPELSE